MPEMNGQAIGITDFTGEFVRWHYRPGQKFIQLIFRTPEGECLSLSRNAQMARSLVPGEVYAVQGEVRTLGARQYVHEPVATLLAAQDGQEDQWQDASEISFMQAHKKLVIIASIVLAMIIGAGAYAYVQHQANQNKPVSSQTPSSQSSQNPSGEVQGASTVDESTLTPAAQDDTAATTPTPTAPTSAKPKTTITTPVQPVTQPAVTQPTPTAPAPAAQPVETPVEPAPTPVEETPPVIVPEPTPPTSETPTPTPEPTNP